MGRPVLSKAMTWQHMTGLGSSLFGRRAKMYLIQRGAASNFCKTAQFTILSFLCIIALSSIIINMDGGIPKGGPVSIDALSVKEEERAKTTPKSGKKRALLALAGAQVIDNGEGQILNSLFVNIRDALGLNIADLGIISASKRIGGLLFSPVWGILSDRYGRKNVLGHRHLGIVDAVDWLLAILCAIIYPLAHFFHRLGGH